MVKLAAYNVICAALAHSGARVPALEKRAQGRSLLGRFWGNLTGETHRRLTNYALRSQAKHVAPIWEGARAATNKSKLYKLPTDLVQRLAKVQGVEGARPVSEALERITHHNVKNPTAWNRAARVALRNEQMLAQTRNARTLTRVGTAAVPIIGGGMYLGSQYQAPAQPPQYGYQHPYVYG